jgi:hypothetical protein
MNRKFIALSNNANFHVLQIMRVFHWNPGKSSLVSGAPTLWYPGMSTSIPFNYCLLFTDQLIVDQ